MLAIAVLLSAGSTFAATLIVTNAADSGPGSLRDAISTANATPGLDTIRFGLGGAGPYTISPTTALPVITDPLIIDGNTQPGFSGKPIVELNGAQAGNGANGLWITGGSSLVTGLAINRFGNAGILCETKGTNIIAGNFIGTDLEGANGRPNLVGILVLNGSSFNTIGGTLAGAGNVISGNDSSGISLEPDTRNNIVEGNLIGTDASGSNRVANKDGITLNDSVAATIGGTNPGAGNVISGNLAAGIVFIGSNATSNQVQGNFIGLKRAGLSALGNGGGGIAIGQAPGNTIGGTDPSAGNVISGNSGDGISVQGATAAGNVIQGNIIGLDVNGNAALGNSGSGVVVLASVGNTIGGVEPEARNVISANAVSGVRLAGTGHVMQGNLIGTDASGSLARPNGTGGSGGGVLVTGTEHTIGGSGEGRNVISGNLQDGLAIVGTNIVVQGNFIGTDVTGAKVLGNRGNGMLLDNGSQDNTVGGPTADDRNVIAGNGEAGILLRHPASSGNVVQGNFVGLNADGTAALGNTLAGVSLAEGAHDNLIGGFESGEGNVISGNHGAGLSLSDSGTENNSAQGNFIGTDARGDFAVPNATAGVVIFNSARNNQTGGSGAGEGNRIAFNRQEGVLVQGASATGNPIVGNSIFANGGLGINLQPAGEPGGTITLNDALDADSGPNRLQNFPVITNVTYSPGAAVILGTLRSTPDSSFNIDLYANLSVEPTGFGEGQFYLGSTPLDTDETGNGSFSFTVSGGFSNQYVTATATDLDTGDTSEFSEGAGGLRITSIGRAGASMVVSFTTATGKNYQLDRAGSLAGTVSWTTVTGASSVAGNGGVVSVIDNGAAGQPMRYYRAVQLP